MKNEHQANAIQTTALVHEVHLRLDVTLSWRRKQPLKNE